MEVNLQSGGWVDSSLHLWVDVYKDQVKQYPLTIPASQRGELDFAGIDHVAAAIARDLGQGREGNERLCAKIAEQIGPDAREYAAWIVEVENNIRAEFWRAMNQELEGHLKQAEKLHEAAKKWRKDYDEWVKAGGSVKVTRKENAPSSSVSELSAEILEMPPEQKSGLMKILEGLSKLPGAVCRGLRPKVGEIVKGLEFGFRAAGIVMKKSAWLILEDVCDALDSGAMEAVKIIFEKPIEKRIGARKAFHVFLTWNIITFGYGRWTIKEKIKRRYVELQSLALRIDDEIIKIKKELYPAADIGKE